MVRNVKFAIDNNECFDIKFDGKYVILEFDEFIIKTLSMPWFSTLQCGGVLSAKTVSSS